MTWDLTVPTSLTYVASVTGWRLSMVKGHRRLANVWKYHTKAQFLWCFGKPFSDGLLSCFPTTHCAKLPRAHVGCSWPPRGCAQAICGRRQPWWPYVLGVQHQRAHQHFIEKLSGEGLLVVVRLLHSIFRVHATLAHSLPNALQQMDQP